MSEKGSVFQKGGGGTNFEQNVQTAFLVTMLIGGDVPCVPSSTISEIALQVTNLGFETDDLMVVAKSVNEEHRLLIQIKHNIAFTLQSQVWKEVLTAFWKDFNNTSFNKGTDKLIVVSSGLTKNDRNHLKTLFNWANTHSCATNFISEVNRIKANREQLDIFRTILKEANNNTALTDEALWEFLKCVDVLEYDFLNEGSVSKTYFLNLIKLCKNKSSILDEKGIWDCILSYVSNINPNGGSVTLESVKIQDFYKQFDITQILPYSKAVAKLKKDSAAILQPIKSFVGFGDNAIHFQRTELLENLLKSITDFQFTFVVGKPGMGKTAIIKELLSKDYSNASIFVFRADQFNAPTLANVFSNAGISESIEDIFTSVSLIPDKIVFIDACEKLLESDPECAFREFISLIKTHPDVKVVLTSRKYAFDLLSLKFDISYNELQTIEIPSLGDNEFDLASDRYANLNVLAKNEKIKELLLCPKYLDFTLRTIDKTKNNLSNISATGFKELLWNELVVDSQNTKNGLPIKREKAFISIAVKRAKEMKLFTKPDDDIDAEALVCLEKDDVIFQEKDNRKYSPTHDILEDWALTRYVSEKYDDSLDQKNFLMSLGTEPAIRRAFRLWVENHLNDNTVRLTELIRISLTDTTIENYWADEILTAVFRSESCSNFFKTFEKELLLNNCGLFNKCLNIIRTCCKESFFTYDNNYLVPIGDGWKSALLLINSHLQQLNSIKMPIITFITDWYSKLLLKYKTVDSEEQEAAKSIVLFYIGEIENGTLVLDNSFYENSLISILFDLASISKEEIKSLIGRCYNKSIKGKSWKIRSFYDKVKERILSGIGNVHLVNELPDLVVEVAWKEWKYIPKEKEIPDDHAFILPHQLQDDECWGINANYRCFPSGIYKTPFYTLLKYHPKKSLEFIVEFVNRAVDFYVNFPDSHSCYKHQINKVDVVIDDKTVETKYACAELWMAFRGHSVTSYLLESLLMSLEKYLLELAGMKSKTSRIALNRIFDYVIRNSNNIAPLAVLSSVTMAYPEEVGAAMLPLFSVKEFYNWDLDRALHEHSSLAPFDDRIPFAQKERWKSNQLPHRKKYQRGLLDFIVDYQFNIKVLNRDLFKIFDMLKSQSQSINDIAWKKNLLEMDVRNHTLGEYDAKLGGFPVFPKYNEEIDGFIKDNQDEYLRYQETSKYAGLLLNAWKNNELISLEEWIECYEYYTKKDNNTVLLGTVILDRPVTLAYLGLQIFSEQISKKQKEWCVKQLCNTIVDIIQDTYHYGGISAKYNITEKEIALSSFHLLIPNVNNEEDVNEIVLAIIYTLIAPLADYELDKIILYIRETFSNHYPTLAKRVWLVLIKLAEYRKTHPYTHYAKESDIQNEDDFIHRTILDKGLRLDLSKVSFDQCDRFVLYRTLVLTPIRFDDTDYYGFITHLLPMLIGDLESTDISLQRLIRGCYKSLIDIERYLASCLLVSDLKYSIPIFKSLIESALKHKTPIRYGRGELLEFVKNILDFYVIKLRDNGVLGIQEKIYEEQIANFWSLWNVFYDLIPEDGTCPLIETLMLDIRFLCYDGKDTPDVNDWKVLQNQQEFYKKLLLGKGKFHINSAITVFSTIGNEAFMPDGISWIVEVLESNPELCECLSITQADRMIKRIFYQHISIIKSNKKLIEDYLWILNKMVELGSSNAYFIRENVITYKKTC